MMRVLSMTGFRKMCEEMAPALFVFDTENQPNGMCKDAKLVMRYPDVVFMMNPNRICFKNEMGTLCFNRVKEIGYHDDVDDLKRSAAGKIFSIVCGNTNSKTTDVSYIIVVDEKFFK